MVTSPFSLSCVCACVRVHPRVCVCVYVRAHESVCMHVGRLIIVGFSVEFCKAIMIFMS